MKIDIDKLRRERLSREAKRANTAAPAKTSKSPTPSRSAVKPAPVKASAVPMRPAAKADVLTAFVIDPTTVTKNASFNVDLYGAGTENPHWLVVADGRPLGEIQYADQDASLISRDTFAADSYGQAVAKALSLEGTRVLANLKCRVYQAAVSKSAAVESIRKEVTASADSSVRVARSELRANMMNVLGLVLKAHAKNVLAGNDLKHALFSQMQGVGIDERTATHVIETAWQKGAGEYFDSCFAKAEEWMDLPTDAYTALAKQIDQMPHRSVEPITVASDVPSEAHNLPIAPAQSVTASATHAVDYGTIFGFGR